MTPERVYLDYNASAPLLAVARDAQVMALEAGNPSSVHAEGRAARRIVEQARADVAALVGADPANVIFTSGATEAAATLVTGSWRMGRSPLRVGRLYTSASDHPCILRGGSISPEARTVIAVDRDGVVDLGALDAALAAHDRSAHGPALVAIHAANNETGVIQPIAEIAAIAKAAGGISVFDAVQSTGKVPVDLSNISADFLILSSHKIGGPKGVGAIVAAGGVLMPEPLVSGGGQERGHRAGTENVAGIAGFGAAAREALATLGQSGHLVVLRDRIEAAILEVAPDATIYGRGARERLPNTVFFSVPGVKTETAQIGFDLAGIALSAGSACFSGKVGASHVLTAMGFGDQHGALRVSIGRGTTPAHVERFAEVLRQVVERAAKAERRVA